MNELGFIFGVVGCLGTVISIIALFWERYSKNGLKVELKKLSLELNSLKKESPIKIIHNVLMDGATSAGKTTFFTRILNPVSTRKSLLGLAATADAYSTVSIPICWEKEEARHTKLHMLKFFDVSGERGATVINSLNTMAEESENEPNSVLVIVMSLEEDKFKDNEETFHPKRLEMAYGNDNARRVIKSVIIFFNKTDMLSMEKRKRLLTEQEDKIKRVFQEQLQSYPVKFFDGSALDGNGVHSCYGGILEELDLAHNFNVEKDDE